MHKIMFVVFGSFLSIYTKMKFCQNFFFENEKLNSRQNVSDYSIECLRQLTTKPCTHLVQVTKYNFYVNIFLQFF